MMAPAKPAHSQLEVVNRGGLQIAVRHWPTPASRWSSLLIIHGLAEHSGRYEHTGQAFTAAGIDTWALDLRGCGASSGRRAYVQHWDDYLDDVDTELEAIRSSGPPVVLLGHSLGALVALSYALSDRPLPDLLVLSA